MSPISSRIPLPQYITTLIQVTVQKTMGRYRLTESDRDDLEQQIALEILRRRSQFDPGKKVQVKTFLARLVEHAIADIIAARKAGCRDYRREDATLDEWVKDDAGNWTRCCDTVTEDDAGRRVGRPCISRGDHHDLAIDLADAASSLSPRLREIFEHYAVLGSAREVAKATGLHHSSVCDAIKQIRTHFETAGLAIYLPMLRPNPTDRDTRW